MSIDFNQLIKQADAAGFTLLPDGDYDVVVEKSESKPAQSGKPMIRITYVVEHGPHAKRKLFNNHVLSTDNDNALRFFFEAMTAYGLGRDYWTQPGASLDAAAPALVGRRVRVTVGHKEYPANSGQERNEVTKVMPAAGAAGAAVPGPGPSVAVPATAPSPAVPNVVVPGTPAVPVAQSAPAPGPVAAPAPYVPSGDEEPF